MIDESTRFRGSAGNRGLFGTLLGLIGAFTTFAESRVGLFAAESKAALIQLMTLIVCLVVALMFFAIGYIFLIASAVVWIAHMAGINWWWIALATAGAHFLITVILLLVVRRASTKPLFPLTSAELEKDRQWLKSLDERNHSNS